MTGVQIPTWDAGCSTSRGPPTARPIATRSRALLAEHGLEITELSTHLQGQLVAVHPAYDARVRRLRAPAVRGNPEARQAWAVDQLKLAAKASRQSRPHRARDLLRRAGLALPLSLAAAARGSGRRQRSTSWRKRWRPILDAFDAAGVDVCYEIHPGEDLHDGATFEMFLERVEQPPALPTCSTIPATSCCSSSTTSPTSTSTTSGSRCSTSRTPSSIRPAGRASTAASRAGSTAPGRFRSLGDGQVDFAAIFSKLAQYDLRRLGGARMGVLHQASAKRAPPKARRSSRATSFAVDRAAPSTISPAAGTDQAANRRMLGIA